MDDEVFVMKKENDLLKFLSLNLLIVLFVVAQATAATSTGDDASARAAALGRMTTAYTIGATIGPAVGGFLAEQGDFYIGKFYIMKLL